MGELIVGRIEAVCYDHGRMRSSLIQVQKFHSLTLPISRHSPGCVVLNQRCLIVDEGIESGRVRTCVRACAPRGLRGGGRGTGRWEEIHTHAKYNETSSRSDRRDPHHGVHTCWLKGLVFQNPLSGTMIPLRLVVMSCPSTAA